MAANTFFRYDTWVKSATGPAVAGAQVFVCTQPANTALFPPTPLAAIYSDSGGLVPITQPIITDGFGHANFYALPGLYTVVIALNGVIQQVYPDQSLGGIGTAGGGGGGISGSILLETNGVPNGSQVVLNIIGTGAAVVTNDGQGNTTLSVSVIAGPGINVSGGTVSTKLVPTGYAAAQGGTTSINTSGWLLQSYASSGFTLTSNNATNTVPVYLHSPTSSSLSGANGNYHSSTSNLISLGQVSRVRSKIRLNQTTNVRMWVGLVTEVTVLTSDNLNANVAAFRYSTNAGDTTWQCYTATDSTHFTVTPASVNFLDATTFHTFEIQYTGTSVLFYIDNTLVGTSTTNLPTLGTLSHTIGIDNITTAYSPSFDFAWCVAEERDAV